MKPQQPEQQLSELLDAIESWRRQSKKPTLGMPPEFWADAIGLAKQMGLGPVARTLKLNHGKLKKLVAPQAQAGELTRLVCQKKASSVTPTFVEIPPATVSKGFGSSVSCLLEVESVGRGRLRARIENATAFDVATILRDFAG